MLRKVLTWFFGLLMIFIMITQLIVPFTQGKISFFNSEGKVDIEQAFNEEKQRMNQFLNAMADDAARDHKALTRVTTSYDDQSRSLEVKEQTKDSLVMEYLVEHSNGSKFYMNNSEPSVYLANTDASGWVKSEQTRVPSLKVHFLKLLLETNEDVEIEDVNDSTVRVRKKTMNADKIKEFLSYVEIPFYVEDFSVFTEADLTYFATKEGKLASGEVVLTYENKPLVFDLLTSDLEGDIEVPKETVDLKEMEFTKESVEKANQPVDFYELLISKILDGKAQDIELSWLNFYNGSLNKALRGKLIDGKPETAQLKDDEVDVRSQTIGLVLDQYDQFETVEKSEEDAAELAHLETWRLSFENDAEAYFELLAKQFKGLDLSFLKRDSENVLYVVDVTLDKRTHLVQMISFWSATAEDKDIQNAVTYRFDKYDVYNFNNLYQAFDLK